MYKKSAFKGRTTGSNANQSHKKGLTTHENRLQIWLSNPNYIPRTVKKNPGIKPTHIKKATAIIIKRFKKNMKTNLILIQLLLPTLLKEL